MTSRIEVCCKAEMSGECKERGGEGAGKGRGGEGKERRREGAGRHGVEKGRSGEGKERGREGTGKGRSVEGTVGGREGAVKGRSTKGTDLGRRKYYVEVIRYLLKVSNFYNDFVKLLYLFKKKKYRFPVFSIRYENKDTSRLIYTIL